MISITSSKDLSPAKYAWISSLMMIIIAYYGEILSVWEVILGALIGIVYALSDEFHQSFTPGRSPKIIDIVIDSEGNLFGNLFILLFIIFIRNKKEEA